MRVDRSCPDYDELKVFIFCYLLFEITWRQVNLYVNCTKTNWRTKTTREWIIWTLLTAAQPRANIHILRDGYI